MEQQNTNPAEFQIVEQNLVDDMLTLKVKVDTEVVNRAYRKVHKVLLKQVRVPGFRPGKIPLPVLSNAVGKENFVREVRRELLPTYYYSALEQTQHRPVSDVAYDDEYLANGEPFAFSAKVSVFPEAKLPEYGTLSVKQPPPRPVEDDEIEKVLKERQKRYARTRNAEDGVVKDGDFVLLSFTVTIDGREYHTLSRTNHTLIVGEDAYLPGFDANLVGKPKGEEFTFALELPRKGIENEALHGKKAMVKGKIKSVQRVEMPALDDEFAKDIGDFQTLAELKKKIKTDLEKDHERAAREEFSENIKKALVDAIDVTLPDSLVNRETDERLVEFKQSLEGKTYSFEDYLTETGKDEAALKAELREKIIADLKFQCALDEVAKRENLAVTDEEFGQRIQMLGQALHKDPDEILESLDSSGRRIIQRQEMVREKAFGKLRETLAGK